MEKRFVTGLLKSLCLVFTILLACTPINVSSFATAMAEGVDPVETAQDSATPTQNETPDISIPESTATLTQDVIETPSPTPVEMPIIENTESESPTPTLDESPQAEDPEKVADINEDIKSAELIDQREENIKYYELENGANQAVVFGMPVHYFEDGEYKEIDNSLTLVTDKDGQQKYTNTANSFKAEISPNSGEAAITKGEYELAWSVIGLSESITSESEAGLTKQQWSEQSESEKRATVANLAAKIKYDNAFSDAIDLEYIVVSNQVKQYIVLAEKSSFSTWTEQIHVKGLVLIKDEDNTIYAKDSKTGDIVFSLPAPYMADSGEGDISYDIDVELESKGDSYTITYTLDEAWLEKATYPVLIDPTVSVNTGTSGSLVDENRICQSYPTRVYRTARMCTGYGASSHINMSLVRFNQLPAISASKIYGVHYTARTYSSFNDTSTVEIHNVTANWSPSTATWNNMHSNYSGTVSASRVISGPSSYNVAFTWNGTGVNNAFVQLVRGWYTTNYGLLMKDSSDVQNWYKEWSTWDDSKAYDGAKLTIDYDNVVPSAPTSISTTPNASSSWTNDTTLNLNWSGITDSGGSGLKRIVYRIDGGSWQYPSTGYGVASGSVPITISSSGTHTIQLRAIDNVDNWGSVATVYYKLDTSVNNVSYVNASLQESEPNAGDNIEVLITFPAATDTLSGIDEYKLYRSVNGGAYQLVGTYESAQTNLSNIMNDDSTVTYKVIVYDNVGNVSTGTYSSQVTTPDRTGPSVPTSVSINPGDWTNDTTPAVSWSGIADVGSAGLKKAQYCITTGESTTFEPIDTQYGTASGTFYPDLSDDQTYPDGIYKIYIRGLDNSDPNDDGQCNVGAEDFVYYYKDTQIDNAQIDAPTDGTIVQDDSLEIEFIATDDHFLHWYLEYGIGLEPASWNPITDDDEAAAEGSFTWNDQNGFGTLNNYQNYTIRLRVTDQAGNELCKYAYFRKAPGEEAVSADLTITVPTEEALIDSDNETISFTGSNEQGTLYVNNESVDTDVSGSISFDASVYDSENGCFVYPEGSKVSLYVRATDQGEELFSAQTNDVPAAIYNLFIDTDGLTMDDTQLENESIILAYDGQYASPGTVSQSLELSGDACYVLLDVDETTPAGTDIVYAISEDGGDSWISITPGATTATCLNENSTNVILRATLTTTDTGITPHLNDWRLSVRYIEYLDIIEYENDFDSDERGITDLDQVNKVIVLQGGDSYMALVEEESVYYTTGTFLTSPRNLAGKANAVTISADEDLPEGTSITYECSADGGTNWQAISTLDEQIDLEYPGKQLLICVTLTTTNTSVTPKLLDLSVNVLEDIANTENVHMVQLIDPPDNLTAMPNVNYKILVRWDASETEGVTYNVYRSTTQYFEPSEETLVAEGLTETSWSDFNLNYGETFHYKVVAVKDFNGHPRYSLASNDDEATVVDEDELNKRLGVESYYGYTSFSTATGTGYIDVSSGNLAYNATDLVVTGPRFVMTMRRTYNSESSTKTALGEGWDFSFNTCLLVEYNWNGEEFEKTGMILKDGDGSIHRFAENEGTYDSAYGTYMELSEMSVESEYSYSIKRKDDVEYLFDKNLRLVEFTEPNGYKLTFEYSPTRGNLETIENSVGDTITLAYDEDDMLISATDSAGRVYTYTIDNDMLVAAHTVVGLDTYKEEYEYYEDQGDKEIRFVDPINSAKKQQELSYDYTSVEFDAEAAEEGMATGFTNAKGESSVITYNSGYTTTTDEYDRDVTYDYNEDGQVTRITNDLGYYTDYEYGEEVEPGVIIHPTLVTSMSYQNTVGESQTPETIEYTYEYDESGNIEEITGPEDMDEHCLNVQYSYDDQDYPNKPTQIETNINGADSRINKITYDDYGNVETNTILVGGEDNPSVVDGLDSSTTYTYYADNVVDGEVITSYRINQVESITDSYGKKTVYMYDEKGRVVQIDEYDKTDTFVRTVSTYSYDDYNQPDVVTDGEGNEYDYKYNALGLKEEATGPEVDQVSATFEWEYDRNGNLIHEIDAKGVYVNYEYDELNRLVGTSHLFCYEDIDEDPHSRTIETSIAYEREEEAGEEYGYSVVTYTDGNGNTTEQHYNTAGWLVSVEDAYDDTVVTYTYDMAGNPVTATDQAGRVVETYYDALNRPYKTVTDPAGENIINEVEYDLVGNTTSATDGESNETLYEYDELGRLTQVLQTVDSKDAVTAYEYDIIDNNNYINRVSKNSDDTGGALVMDNVSETMFDSTGRKVMDVNKGDPNEAGDMTAEYEYNDNNQVTLVTRNDGSMEKYTYDERSRLVRVDFYDAQGNPEYASDDYYEYEYDLNGNVEQETITQGQDSETTSYAYDTLNRTMQMTEGDPLSGGMHINYQYDNAGNITKITYDNSSINVRTLEYAYDDDNRIVSIELNDDLVRQYTYNQYTGDLESIKDYREFATAGDGFILRELEYDTAGRLDTLTYTDYEDGEDPGTLKESYTLAYDDRNYITSETLYDNYGTANTVEKTYVYDPIGRLTSAEVDDGQTDVTTTYTYDLLGNRLTMDDETTETAYEYDQFNRLESITAPIDEDSEYLTTFGYDNLGNQTSELYEQYDNQTPTELKDTTYGYDVFNHMDVLSVTENETTTYATYAYNVAGQRIEKVEDSDTTRYYYTGSAILYTTDEYNGFTTENILTPGGEVIASKRFEAPFNNEYLFYNYDVRGSTASLIEPDGDRATGYEYDEFGNTTENIETQGTTNEIEYTGSIGDDMSGLIYMNARYYNPTTGRFLQQDTYTGNPYDPWTQHLYSYCGNNPTNFVDPTGHRYVIDANGSVTANRYGKPERGYKKKLIAIETNILNSYVGKSFDSSDDAARTVAPTLGALQELTTYEYSVWGSDENGKAKIKGVATYNNKDYCLFPGIDGDNGDNKFTIHSHDLQKGNNTYKQRKRYHSETDIVSIGSFGLFDTGSQVSMSYVVHNNNVYRMDFDAARTSGIKVANGLYDATTILQEIHSISIKGLDNYFGTPPTSGDIDNLYNDFETKIK